MPVRTASFYPVHNPHLRFAPSPAFGVGTQWFNADDDEERSEQLATIISDALTVGYRHIDCAQIYNSHKSVGRGLKKFFFSQQDLMKENPSHREVRRRDLWITDKIWNTHHYGKSVRGVMEKALEDMSLSYIDLLLIHYPIAWTAESDMDDASTIKMETDITLADTWDAMQDMVKYGFVRKLGVSNFNLEQLKTLMNYAKQIPPSQVGKIYYAAEQVTYHQIECHPHLPQYDLWKFGWGNDIRTMCYGAMLPLRVEKLMTDEFSAAKIANDIAIQQNAEPHFIDHHSPVTAGQVLLKYLATYKLIPVITTSNPERLIENYKNYLHDLSESDLKKFELSSKTIYRHYNPKGWKGTHDQVFFENDARIKSLIPHRWQKNMGRFKPKRLHNEL